MMFKKWWSRLWGLADWRYEHSEEYRRLGQWSKPHPYWLARAMAKDPRYSTGRIIFGLRDLENRVAEVENGR